MTENRSLHIGILTNHINNIDGVTKHIYNLIMGFQTYNPSVKFTVFCEGGDFISEFTKIGIEVITIKNFSHDNRTPVNFLLASIQLVRWIQKKKINIIHSHNHYHANLASFSKIFSGIKTVQTNHGILPEKGILPHFIGDKIIAINQHVVEYFRTHKQYHESKFKFIRCGIPFTPSDSPKSTECIKFIAAGRLTIDKGFDLFIKAAAAIKSKYTINLEFLLAGDGPKKDNLLKLNDSLSNPVKYLGNLSNIEEIFSVTDALINPSRSQTEGFPRTIVEAVLKNNFLITARFRGVEYDFDDSLDGYAFNVDDLDGLILCIERYLNNPEEVKSRLSNFHNKCKDIFSLELMINKTFELYNELNRF